MFRFTKNNFVYIFNADNYKLLHLGFNKIFKVFYFVIIMLF